MEAKNSDVGTCNLNVLVVDDEASMTKLIKMTLAELGVTQVFVAKDGREAMKLLGELGDVDQVDMVICDWNMPRMSGLELLEQLRTVDRNMPFLMLTGRADIDSVKEAMAMGVNDYLAKPFTPDVLKQKVTRLAQQPAESR